MTSSIRSLDPTIERNSGCGWVHFEVDVVDSLDWGLCSRGMDVG